MYLLIEDFEESVIERPLPCPRCNGEGILQQHRRISGGVCFKCDGKGTSLKTEVVKVTGKSKCAKVECTIMEESDSFDAMFDRYQKKKADDEAAAEEFYNDFFSGWPATC